MGDLGLDGRIYLADKVGRPEIDKFAHALQRDGRKQGFFIGWEFSKDADREIERLRGLGGEDARVIFPVRVQRLIAEDFGRELLGLLG